MKIQGIILAGGFSRRAGTNKLTLNIGKETVIDKCVCGMYHLCSEIIVVGGYRIEEIKDILDKYSKVKLIYNSNYINGMFSSVKKGLSYITSEKFFLIPGDYAVINKKTYEDMLKVDNDIVIPTYNGIKGHPLLMKSYLIEELLKDFSCNTLRDFINKKNFYTVNIEDPGINTNGYRHHR